MTEKISQNTNLLSKKWRAITYDYEILATYGNTSRAYCLTDFQVAWLLSNTDYFAWQNRWVNCPCTEDDMYRMKADLEYSLMSCIDLQPYQLQSLYDQLSTNQLDALQSLWDADPTPSNVNPSTPDDYYTGDDSQERIDALCTACKIYVYSYAQNWVVKAQTVLGIVAVVGLFASITIVGGVIASILVGGLAYITSLALDAMQDENALDDVACCMNEYLQGLAITQANFEDCLGGCGFDVGSNQAIIRDIVASDIGVFKNWLTFINTLGNAYDLAQIGITDCPCPELEWVWDSDFPSSDEGFDAVNYGYGNAGVWAMTTGWSTTNVRIGSVTYSKIMSIEIDILPTAIETISINYDITKGTWEGSDGNCVEIYVRKDDDTPISSGILFVSETSGSGKTFNFDVNEPDIKYIRIFVRSSRRSSASYNGSAKLNSVTVNGTGINPFS